MARGDKTRALGSRLDEAHTKLVTAHFTLQDDLKVLEGILSRDLLQKFGDLLEGLDSANDDVQSIYGELDRVADDLDSDEGDDESDKRQLEKELAEAQERIEALDAENDDLRDRV
jgi:hypothetical protein